MASHNETSVSEVSSASSDFSDFSASDYDRKMLRVLLHNVTEWQRDIRPFLIEMLEFQHYMIRLRITCEAEIK